MMDGRLKTLHPKIHGGLLALRDNEEHMKALREHGIELIDMVVINLYRFEDTVAKEGCTLEEAIENIDIGGPTMLRAASKNYRFVSVVTDPDDYPKILAEMKKTGGKISEATNFELATKTFQLTARYDGAISNYLGTTQRRERRKEGLPRHLHLPVRQGAGPALRRESPPEGRLLPGEGRSCCPALSRRQAAPGQGAFLQQHHGQRRRLADGLRLRPAPAVVIMKHANPCGAATSKGDMAEAYRKALETDPVSAFGGIVALNRPVDKKAAEEIVKTLPRGDDCPGLRTRGPQGILESKKNVRPHRDRGVLHRRQDGLRFPPRHGRTSRPGAGRRRYRYPQGEGRHETQARRRTSTRPSISPGGSSSTSSRTPSSTRRRTSSSAWAQAR